MIRLLVADFAREFRVWLGFAAVSASVAAALAVAFGFIAQGMNGTDHRAQSLYSSLGAVIAAFTIVSVLIVGGSSAALVTVVRRRTLARWQIVGVLPTRVQAITLGQVAMAAAVGAIVGTLLGMLLLRGASGMLLTTIDVALVPPPVPLGTWGVSAAVSVATMVVSGWRGARAAAATSPVLILRLPEPRRGHRAAWIRGAVTLLTGSGVVMLVVSLTRGTFRDVANAAPLLAPLIALVIAIAGPLVYPAIIHVWSAVVPARASVSWYLARRSAIHRVSFSSAAIGPIMVAVVLAAGLESVGATLARASEARGDFTVAAPQLLLLFGAPMLVALVGAASAVYTTGADRARARALLVTAGASRGTVIATAVGEAVIFVVTGLALGLIAVAVAASIVAGLVGVGVPTVRLTPALVVAAMAAVLMLAATVLPVLFERRSSPLIALAGQ